MTPRLKNPMSSTQVARMGGLGRSHKVPKDKRDADSAKGGNTVVERYGKVHMTRLAHKRAGRLQGGKQ